MRRSTIGSSAIILIALGFALSACTKQSSQDTTTVTASSTTSSPDALSTAGVAPSATDSAAIAAASPAEIAAASPASVAVASPGAAPNAAAMSRVKFTDIKGVDGETAIKELAALGVFDSSSGRFRPHDPLRRALYVEWLVKANNIYVGATNNPSLRIRLAEPGATPTFVDVGPSLAEFKYIQGMADAGLLQGYDKTHFKPNKLLSREELLAILIQRNMNGNAGNDYTKISLDDLVGYISDAAQLSKVYRALINEDHWNQGNIARIFGTIKVLHPQQNATREEAAVALEQFTGLFGRGTALSAKDALK
jgi:predicted flap endonuclease-1-like 5' DNA nuclease